MHFQDVIVNRRTPIDKREINEFKPYAIELLEKALYTTHIDDTLVESELPREYVTILKAINVAAAKNTSKIILFKFDNGITELETFEIVNEKKVFTKINLGNAPKLISEYLKILTIVLPNYLRKCLRKAYESKIMFNDTIEFNHNRYYNYMTSLGYKMDQSTMSDIDYLVYKTKADPIVYQSLMFGTTLTLIRSQVSKMKMKEDAYLGVNFSRDMGKPVAMQHNTTRFSIRLFNASSRGAEYIDMSDFDLPSPPVEQKVPPTKNLSAASRTLAASTASVAAAGEDD